MFPIAVAIHRRPEEMENGTIAPHRELPEVFVGSLEAPSAVHGVIQRRVRFVRTAERIRSSRILA